MRLKDAPVGLRLAATLLLPVALLVFVAQAELRASWTHYHHMYELRDATREIEIVGDFMHALQVERGTTAGYLGSRGTSMGEAMGTARQASDETHEAFEHAEHLIVKVGDQYAGPLMEKIDPMTHDGLDSMRERIDVLAVGGSEAFDFYTDLIDGLAGLAISLHHGVDEVELAAPLSDYALLLMAKEFAGQERGLGAGAIGAGGFTPRSYFRMSELAGKEQALIDLYKRGVGEELAQAADQQLGPISAEVTTLRESLLGRGLAADLSGVDQQAWFGVTTQRIEILRDLGKETIEQIVAKAVAMGEASYEEFLKLAAIVALVTLAVLAITFVLARSITGPLLALTGAMNALLEGKTEMAGVDGSRKDEIGEMARAVQGFIVQTEERVVREREEEAARVAERERVRAATEADRAETQAASMLAVQELGTALGHLAEGNLGYRIETRFATIFEPLRTDFNRSLSALEDAIAAVVDVSSSLRGNTDELRMAADDLSRRTEQQAASLEETAAALSEVSNTVTESSRRADAAGSIIRQTALHTRDSNAIVDKTVAAIHAISQSSDEITRFVSVIDEMAFQTNLLALNAGVEAARAGEAGKGFAVVASEVRELAQRSADAAREIKELIARSVGEVEEGVAMSEKTSEALKSILEQVDAVHGDMDAIASAARSQSVALGEVNQAIAQMDIVTQQNAAMVEQSTAATSSLADQSRILGEKISGFVLSSGGRTTALAKAA
ncbi:methyl-accepting chemotaxis protein [Jiella marina]|uniref:methyl-accepting chemotaxis protein n=1 Tax=Jiella sp. LLJ827 TaxID=2917712 RepID=UPI00210075FD|nr:methyl-accepting chemotaxis protein [Jiella sp. LLJ827]MCQ0987696.1 methyl-accepting chemotaxis protein [Jiella sp. LLJ827]